MFDLSSRRGRMLLTLAAILTAVGLTWLARAGGATGLAAKSVLVAFKAGLVGVVLIGLFLGIRAAAAARRKGL